MSFFVDVVTEDTFYENLMLGVFKTLENTNGIKNVSIEKREACDRNSISTWEQKHCCSLPEDLRNFYLSVDGFLITWSLSIAGEEFRVGRMEINNLSCLRRFIVNKEEQSGTEQVSQVPLLNIRCKLFEIGQGDSCKVLMAYHVRVDQSEPEFWLYREDADDWHRLTDNFTKYFRMMLVHLGLPMWQKCIAGVQLPTWVEQVYYLIGPHLLSNSNQPIQTVSTTMWHEGPTNTIDPAIFRVRENKQKSLKNKK